MHCAQEFDKVHVIIDAVDECGVDQLQTILSFLDKLLGYEKIIFKVIVSSRPHLREQFICSQNSAQLVIEAEDLEGDLQTYIKSKLIRFKHRWPGSLRGRILETITRQAHGK